MSLREVQIKLRKKYLFCSKMNTINIYVYIYMNTSFSDTRDSVL